jgi:hypothetical protein
VRYDGSNLRATERDRALWRAELSLELAIDVVDQARGPTFTKCPHLANAPGCPKCRLDAIALAGGFPDRPRGAAQVGRGGRPRNRLPVLPEGCFHDDAPGCERCRWLERHRVESRKSYYKHREKRIAWQIEYNRRRRESREADARSRTPVAETIEIHRVDGSVEIRRPSGIVVLRRPTGAVLVGSVR